MTVKNMLAIIEDRQALAKTINRIITGANGDIHDTVFLLAMAFIYSCHDVKFNRQIAIDLFNEIWDSISPNR